jgi:hypothetical protein
VYAPSECPVAGGSFNAPQIGGRQHPARGVGDEVADLIEGADRAGLDVLVAQAGSRALVLNRP